MLEQLTAISLFIVVPCILGVFQKNEKDHTAVYLLMSLLLIALYFAFFPYVGVFQRWFNWQQFFNQAMSVAALTLSILIARRLEKAFVSGMMVCASSLIVLSTFDIIEEIWK